MESSEISVIRDEVDDDTTETTLSPRYRPGNIIAYHSFPGRTIIKSPFEKPIRVSYGIVAFVWKTRKWLIVKRAYTTDFLKIVEGSYRNSELNVVLSRITVTELKSLQSLSRNSFKFNAMFKTVFPDRGLDELVYSKERFLASCDVIRNFVDLITQPNSGVWQFPCAEPKARGENPTDVALRAFKDQTGLEISRKEKSFLGRDPFSEKEILGNLLGDIREDCRYWLVIYMEEPHITESKNMTIKYVVGPETKETLDLSKRMIIKEAEKVMRENFLL